PVELVLVVLVGREILQRPPIGPGVEGHHGEALLGEPAGEGAAARSRAHDREIHGLIEGMLAHRHPASDPEYIRSTAADRTGLRRIVRGRAFDGGGRAGFIAQAFRRGTRDAEVLPERLVFTSRMRLRSFPRITAVVFHADIAAWARGAA